MTTESNSSKSPFTAEQIQVLNQLITNSVQNATNAASEVHKKEVEENFFKKTTTYIATGLALVIGGALGYGGASLMGNDEKSTA